MMRSFVAVAALACAAVFSAGAAEARDYPVTLTYAAPASAQQGAPTIMLTSVRDNRGDGHHLYELGSIRGGYGNPLKTLVTEQQVAMVVAQAIRDALGARNLVTESGAHHLEVRINRFDCNQLFPKEAHIELSFRLLDAATNAVLYESTARANQAGGGAGMGIFTPIEPLRALTNQVMNDGIDRMLDDPAFRAALASAAAVAPAPVMDQAPPAEVQAETPATEQPAEPSPTP
jgi:hypothetical protein